MMIRSTAKDLGFFGGELLLGEDALVFEGGQLLELLDVVGGWPLRRYRFIGRASASGAPAEASPWRRATRPLTAVAVPTTTAVRAIVRPIGRRIMGNSLLMR